MCETKYSTIIQIMKYLHTMQRPNERSCQKQFDDVQ